MQVGLHATAKPNCSFNLFVCDLKQNWGDFRGSKYNQGKLYLCNIIILLQINPSQLHRFMGLAVIEWNIMEKNWYPPISLFTAALGHLRLNEINDFLFAQ